MSINLKLSVLSQTTGLHSSVRFSLSSKIKLNHLISFYALITKPIKLKDETNGFGSV